MRNTKLIFLVIFLILITICIVIFFNTIKGIFNKKNEVIDFYKEIELLSNMDCNLQYSNLEHVNIILESNNTRTTNTKNVYVRKNVVNIYSGGIYIVEGSAKHTQIVINTIDNDDVYLILNNVEMNSDSISPLYIKRAKKVFIVLADNSINNLSMRSKYKTIRESDMNSTIFSKEKLIFMGNGTLNINSDLGYGIVAEKDLFYIKGIYNINVGNKGIFSKGNIGILDGNFNINSEDDSIHSNEKICVNGGIINLKTKDDAIHANRTFLINNGHINVKECFEGIEALKIEIYGGNINIISNDDGLNARDCRKVIIDEENYKEFEKDAGLKIIGGTIDIKSGGDCLDSNGNIYVYGGKINLSNFAHVVGDGVDANGDFYIHGGEIYISGSFDGGGIAFDSWGDNIIYGGTCVATTIGINREFVEDSTQIVVTINLGRNKNANDIVKLIDENNNTVISYEPINGYRYIIISSPKIDVGKQYTLQYGEEYRSIIIEKENTYIRL